MKKSYKGMCSADIQDEVSKFGEVVDYEYKKIRKAQLVITQAEFDIAEGVYRIYQEMGSKIKNLKLIAAGMRISFGHLCRYIQLAKEVRLGGFGIFALCYRHGIPKVLALKKIKFSPEHLEEVVYHLDKFGLSLKELKFLGYNFGRGQNYENVRESLEEFAKAEAARRQARKDGQIQNQKNLEMIKSSLVVDLLKNQKDDNSEIEKHARPGSTGIDIR